MHAGVGQRGHHRGHPDAAEANDGHRLPGLRLADIEHRTAAGQHRAAQQRGDRRGNVTIDRHDAGPVDHGMRRETGHAQVVKDLVVAATQPHSAAEQRPGVVSRAARLAGRQPVGHARRAVTATRQERHHHSLTDGHVVDAVADLLDDSGRLVTEQHRRWPHPVAVHHRQVGMAHASGLDAHQQFVGAGRGQLDVGDDDGPGLRERPRRSDLLQHGAPDFKHGRIQP